MMRTTTTSTWRGIGLCVVLVLVTAACSDVEDTTAQPTFEATSAAVAEPANEPVSEPTTEPTVTELEPAVPSNMVRITFDLIPTLDGFPMAEVTEFVVAETESGPTVELGKLDESGSILLPRAVLGQSLLVEAETPDDPFCWWSAFVFVTNATHDRTVDAELDLICA